jgi:protein subunit release factor A
MIRHLELRAAEGGADAQLLVDLFAQAYGRLARRKGWSFA